MLEKNRFSEIVCRELHIAAPAPEELSPAAKRFLAFARQTLRTDPEAAELGKEQA